MKILNLTRNWEPLGGGAMIYKDFSFSDKTYHMVFRSKTRVNPDELVMMTIQGSEEIFMSKVSIAVNTLRNMGFKRISLFCPYFPGARMDRIMSIYEPFTLKVMADFVNNLDFEEVIILHPHSTVAPALIKNVTVINGYDIVDNAVIEIGDPDLILVAPDNGAYHRTFDLNMYLKMEHPVVSCNKVRDVSTGQILRTEVHGDVAGKKCLITDDICDGGRTFIEVAKSLYEKGANDVQLAVSHGIFSKGLPTLIDGGISHIYTSDSYSTVSNVILDIPRNGGGHVGNHFTQYNSKNSTIWDGGTN